MQRVRGYGFGVPDPKNNERSYGFDSSQYEPSLHRSRRRRFKSEHKLWPLNCDQFEILHFSAPSDLAHFLYVMGAVDPNFRDFVTMKELYLAIRPIDKDTLGWSSEEATALLQFASRLGFSLSQELRLALEEFLTGSTPSLDAPRCPHTREQIRMANLACAALVAMVFQFTRHAVEYISLYIEADILDIVRDCMGDATINPVSQQYEDNKPFPNIKLFAWRSSLLRPWRWKLDLDGIVNFVTWARISAVDINGTTYPEVCRIFQVPQGVLLDGNCITNLSLRDVIIFHDNLARLINHLPNVVHFSLELNHDLFEPGRNTELLEPLPSQVIECLQPLSLRLQSLTLVIEGTEGVACPSVYLASTLAKFLFLKKLRIGMWCFRGELLDHLPPFITHLDIPGSKDKTGERAVSTVLSRLFAVSQVWLPRLQQIKAPFRLPVPFNRSIQVELNEEIV